MSDDQKDLMDRWRKSGLKIRGSSANSTRRRDSTEVQSDSDEDLDIRDARCEANRRKIGIIYRNHMQKKVAGNEPDEGKESSLVHFITKNFGMKKCVQYSSKDPNVEGKCYCGDTKDSHNFDIDVPIKWSCPTPKSARSETPDRQMSAKSRNSVVPLLRSEEQMTMQTLTVPNGRGGHKLPPLILEPRDVTSKDSVQQNPLDDSHQGPLFVQRDTCKTVEEQGVGAAYVSPRSPMKWGDKVSIGEYFSTNSFGTVEFANDEARSKPAKYVRISDTASEDKVIELMTKHWKMLQPNRPNLVISVVGGAKNFKLDGKKRETFNRGLVKAAQATHAWIITTGFCMGVMKAVGEAVREGQSLQLNDQRVCHSLRCVGIGHWGYVKKRENLIAHQNFREKITPGCWPATYIVDPIIRHGQPASLEPNHTHFIFVDDGYRNVFRPKTVAEFRAKLERKIAQDFDKGGLKIPVVAVLVEGGIESFEFVKESVNFGIPVVLCQGTGRAADILAYAFKHHSNETTNGQIERKIGPRYQDKVVEKLSGAFSDSVKTSKNLLDEQLKDHFVKIADLVYECCQKENMIVVFDINHHQDLDLAIMSALLKGHARRSDQLNLALKWNRSDVAAEHIFTPDAVWTDQELHNAMVEALRDRKIEFVKLLLQHGVIMSQFLTTDILKDLYNLIKESEQLKVILKLRFDMPLEIIYARIEIMLKKKFVVHIEAINKNRQTLEEGDKPSLDKVTLLKPFRELFLWAVLTNRHEMAKFFWQRNEYPIISALAASKICKMLAFKAAENDLDSAKQYLQYKEEYEQLAVSIINYAHEVDIEKALLLVEQPHTSWGETNCLTMASMACDRDFLATSCCQKAVNQIWKRGLNCSGWEVVIGILMPLYIFKPHYFDTSSLGWSHEIQQKSSEKVPNGHKRVKFTFRHKIRTFYSAPITKFCLWNMIYCLFLLLYSYVLLFDLHYEISWAEIGLHVWVFSMIVNKFWMFCSGYISGADRASLYYILVRNFWARNEMYSEVMHVLGFGFRWLPTENFDWTKVALCIAAFLFYMRLFRSYMASSYLGPQLFVIRKMFKHVFMFLLIVVVVMLSYGVSFQTMMYPQRSFYSGIFFDLLYYPYWEMHGDVELGATIEAQVPGCSGNVTMNADGVWCPRRFWVGTLMMACYMLVSNTLLINLLIAIFSHVFDEVQTNSKQIWKYEMWLLATEFDTKPIFPPPISLFEIFVRFSKWLIRKGASSQTGNPPVLLLNRRQREHLRIFEKECLNEYLHLLKETEMKDISNRAQCIQEKVDSLAKAFDEDRTKHSDHQSNEKEKEKEKQSPNLDELQKALSAQNEKKKKKRDPNQLSSRSQLQIMQNRMQSLEQEIGGLSDMLKEVLVKKSSKSSKNSSTSSDDEKSLHSD